MLSALVYLFLPTLAWRLAIDCPVVYVENTKAGDQNAK